MAATPKRNWIQEERRKTLGDWVPRGGTRGSPAIPRLLREAGKVPLWAYAGVNPASALGASRTAGAV